MAVFAKSWRRAITTSYHPQRRIASIIVTAHAAPKTATNKNSLWANARPQPPPAIRESPISSGKAGSIRGGGNAWFLSRASSHVPPW
jgi:hypothetical protein